MRCQAGGGAHLAAAAAAAAGAGQQHTPAWPATRQAWLIGQQGDLQSLELVTEPLPQELQPGEVLVEARAWGLNLADVFCALGLYKAAPRGAFVPGLEFAGVVVAAAAAPAAPHEQPQQQGGAGAAALPLQPGDRVLGVVRFGGFRSHVVLPAAYLRRVPPDWSFEQAAAYPVQTLTAAYGLFEAGGLQPGACQGATVLVHSAAGGVGLQALQILRSCGASALGLVGQPGKVQLLGQLFPPQDEAAASGRAPCMQFAVRTQSDAAGASQQLQQYLRQAGVEGFDVVLDSLGPGPYFQAAYDALVPCGRHVVFGAGALTPRPGRALSLNLLALLAAPASLLAMLQLAWGWLRRPRLDVLSMVGDNKGVLGFNLIYLYSRLEMLGRLYAALEGLRLPPPLVGRVYGFGDLPAALAFLQSGDSVGKVVLSASPPPGATASSEAAEGAERPEA